MLLVSLKRCAGVYVLLICACVQASGTTSSSSLLGERCQDEVRRLHAFFEQWWNGRLPQDRHIFDSKFTSSCDNHFFYNGPVGVPSYRAGTAEWIFSQWGKRYENSWARAEWVRNRDMTFVITNATTAWADASACEAKDVACQVLFLEHQQVGGSDGPVQTKSNTATLRCGESGELLWVSEVETWWPGFVHGSDSCNELKAQKISDLSIPACYNCKNCLPDFCGKCLPSTPLLPATVLMWTAFYQSHHNALGHDILYQHSSHRPMRTSWSVKTRMQERLFLPSMVLLCMSPVPNVVFNSSEIGNTGNTWLLIVGKISDFPTWDFCGFEIVFSHLISLWREWCRLVRRFV